MPILASGLAVWSCFATGLYHVQKPYGLLRAAHSRNPTCIRNPGYRPTCSYMLASHMHSQPGKQACRLAMHGDRAFKVN